MSRALGQAFFDGLRPDPLLTVSEWADEYAVLSAESAANPGRWHTLPYQREWMDVFTDPEVEEISIQKSARVGYTKCLNHIVGYHVSHAPTSILMVNPTIEDSKDYTRLEFGPMIRDTPVLQGLVGEGRTSTDTLLRKTFPGGSLTLVGANSPGGFRRLSVRIVLNDEIDGWVAAAGDEGDQIALGKKRTEFFWNRKIVCGSTPKVKGASRIETRFEASDQRRFYVPCPFCGAFQYLKWGGKEAPFGIKWPEGEPEKAFYLCEHCSKGIPHAAKFDMVENGYWQPHAEFRGHAGFHIWAAYSYAPNATWGHIAREFTASERDPERLKAWVNLVLGETWDPDPGGKKIKSEDLAARVEDFGVDPAPAGCLVLTAFVDVQGDRLELMVKGWGLGEESWMLRHEILVGDPAQDPVWDTLLEHLDQRIPVENGPELTIVAAGVDAGFMADRVYRFTQPLEDRRIYATRGANVAGKPIISPPSKVGSNRASLIIVGTDTAKDLLSARLHIETPGPGFYHYPASVRPDFFDQLTAERTKLSFKGGRPVRTWVCPPGRRNEVTDLEVGNLAVLRFLNPNLEVIASNRLPDEEAEEPAPRERAEPPAERLRRAVARRRRSSSRGGGFAKGWKS